MDLSYTEEQSLLRDSVASFLAEQYEFEQRRSALASEPHWRPDIWKALSQELQILGAAFPEEVGGFGGGAIENLILMEEFGKALVVEPYLASVVLAGGVLKHSTDSAVRERLQRLIAGEDIYTLAYSERTSRFNVAAVETRANADGNGWILDGHKKLVLAAPYADQIIVSARTSGESRDRNGVTLFALDPKTDGVSITPYSTYDGFRAADIALEGVKLGPEALISEKDAGFELIDRAVDEATAAICGEAVGVMSKLLELTLEYAKNRKQFGKSISSFQALQHRMTDMFVELEQAKSIALLGGIRAESDDDIVRARGVSMTKAQIGKACKKVGQSAIQVHGGMGITDEMAVSHYFKRATVLEAQFGSVGYHLSRIESVGSVEPSAAV